MHVLILLLCSIFLCILENVLYNTDKNVYSVAVGVKALQMILWSIYSVMGFMLLYACWFSELPGKDLGQWSGMQAWFPLMC